MFDFIYAPVISCFTAKKHVPHSDDDFCVSLLMISCLMILLCCASELGSLWGLGRYKTFIIMLQC